MNEAMFFITTSHSEDASLDGLDGITGASTMERAPSDAQQILDWLER